MINRCDNLLPGLKRRFILGAVTGFFRVLLGSVERAAFACRGFRIPLPPVEALAVCLVRAIVFSRLEVEVWIRAGVEK